jgi:hypothetical protein
MASTLVAGLIKISLLIAPKYLRLKEASRGRSSNTSLSFFVDEKSDPSAVHLRQAGRRGFGGVFDDDERVQGACAASILSIKALEKALKNVVECVRRSSKMF